MVHIKNTNFIVDDFRFSTRNNIYGNYIYFLSHMHSDHYRGISNNFSNGRIFCTRETGILLELKFPGVSHLIEKIEYNTPYRIKMNREETIDSLIVFLNANHIIGSAMILFIGYFGTVLYSGDLRFHQNVIDSNPFFFNEDGSTKIQVDELILDNTFCDPVFDFPMQ